MIRMLGRAVRPEQLLLNTCRTRAFRYGAVRRMNTHSEPSTTETAKIVNESLPKIVEIFVGGTRFPMLRETLEKSPRLVREVRQAGVTGHIKDGLPFIDRDPAVFATVLAYMRTGKLLPPKDTIKLTELLWEAKHYELQDLERQLLRTTFFTRLLGDFASNPFESARTLMSRMRELATVAAALTAGWTAFVAYTSKEFPWLKAFYEDAKARLTAERKKSESEQSIDEEESKRIRDMNSEYAVPSDSSRPKKWLFF